MKVKKEDAHYNYARFDTTFIIIPAKDFPNSIVFCAVITGKNLIFQVGHFHWLNLCKKISSIGFVTELRLVPYSSKMVTEVK